MTDQPFLTQFRLKMSTNGLAHLVFDCPGRTMNVLSDAAIADLVAVAAWLPGAACTGLLIRSGKPNAFCVGADLTELGVAYDAIMAAPPEDRFARAFEHFGRAGDALRRIETAGKPVAAAIAGLALGGGCELALAAHHRVMTDDPVVALGLPESLVGLLPGAGGTQRLPRLVGIGLAISVLLDGARLAGGAALAAGVVDRLVPPGEEIAAAEAWLLSGEVASQPWDRPGWREASAAEASAAVAPVRERVLAETLGHYPAPLAILDCIEQGLAQPFDAAIRTEVAAFARLIQRPEPRDMIRTLFVAKTDHDRLARKGCLPAVVDEAVAAARTALGPPAASDAAARAGFGGTAGPVVRRAIADGYWIDGAGEGAAEARALLARISDAVLPLGRDRSASDRRLIDYAVVREIGYPAYLGGPFAHAALID